MSRFNVGDPVRVKGTGARGTVVSTFILANHVGVVFPGILSTVLMERAELELVDTSLIDPDLATTTFADLDKLSNPVEISENDRGPVENAPEPMSDPFAVASPLPANPKQILGDKKPRLTLNPLSAQIAQWEAQFDGALKYGEVNWRENPVEAKTYIDAALRHLRLYENGEKYARDTTVQNLGAVKACCAILIDAELHGTLIDNRSHSPETCDLLHGRGEHMVAHLKAMQAKRDAAKAA